MCFYFSIFLQETIERSYGCEEASTVEQVENDDIKIAGHGRDGERRSWTETKRRPMEELRRGWGFAVESCQWLDGDDGLKSWWISSKRWLVRSFSTVALPVFVLQRSTPAARRSWSDVDDFRNLRTNRWWRNSAGDDGVLYPGRR